MRSLARPPGREGLKLSEESLDETTLRALAKDDWITDRARDRSALLTLWDACQTPDFRKTTQDEHLRLVRTIFEHLTSRQRRLPQDWIAEQFRAVDRLDGEIDMLAQRLAGIRTLAYAANRSDWLADAQHWQGRCRELEDRLSDRLHEKLMQRFIDRRTSALMRGLSDGGAVLAGVGGDGLVTVEGHVVGRLDGLRFEAERGEGALEDKALRQAAQRAVGPEMARRLGRLAAEPDDAFSLSPEGLIHWRGEPAGRLAGGRPFSPRVQLFGELGPEPARMRAQRRLEAFIAAEAMRRLAPLRALDLAMAEGRLSGLARGIGFRLSDAGGVIDRALVGAEVAMLSQKERRAMKALGVRFGAYSLHLPALLEADALDFTAAFAGIDAPGWRPERTGLSRPPPQMKAGAVPDRILAALGMRQVGPWVVSVEALEQFDAVLRAGPPQAQGVAAPDSVVEALGWPVTALPVILKGLGYTVARKASGDQPAVWRRRGAAAATPAPVPPPKDSPFAALAALRVPPVAKRRSQRRFPAQGRE
jgi:ATP-dependent RNA helicase SUPV3L1/SUV3